MPSIRISGVRTMNQRVENATLFHPYFDALALTLDVAASSELLALPNPHWSASFQIIHPRTNAVVIDDVWSGPFQWGPFFWISLGNNWRPSPLDYSTIQRWGLPRGSYGTQDIFGFRGIIRGYSWTPQQIQIVDALDVSTIRWFRAMEIFGI